MLNAYWKKHEAYIFSRFHIKSFHFNIEIEIFWWNYNKNFKCRRCLKIKQLNENTRASTPQQKQNEWLCRKCAWNAVYFEINLQLVIFSQFLCTFVLFISSFELGYPFFVHILCVCSLYSSHFAISFFVYCLPVYCIQHFLVRPASLIKSTHTHTHQTDIFFAGSSSSCFWHGRINVFSVHKHHMQKSLKYASAYCYFIFNQLFIYDDDYYY